MTQTAAPTKPALRPNRLPKPGSFGLVVLLAALTSAGPISTDLYLASFPNLIADLKTDAASAQLTLSSFTLCFGLSGLILGPLADRFGRRPILLAGFIFYFLSSLACALAVSIESLIALRAMQAVGAATGPIVARAVVRDMHDGHEAGRLLAFMAATMGIIPAIAPSLGAAALAFGGWRIQFVIMASTAAIGLGLVFYYLSETLARENRQPFVPGDLFVRYLRLLGDGTFLLPVVMGALAFSGIFAFISGGSLVLQTIYGQSPTEFGLSFGLTVLGYVTGTATGGRLVRRVGGRALIRAGACLLAGSSLIMAASLHWGADSAFMILIPMVGYTCGIGLIVPQSTALALMPYPHMAGTASAMSAALHLGIAATIGIIVGQTYNDTAWPMVGATCLAGLSSFVLMLVYERRHSR